MSYSSLFARIVAISGIVIYGSVLYLTFSVPGWLEDFASSYIEGELVQRIDSSIDDFSPPTREGLLGDLARKAYDANSEKIEVVKGQLKSKAHESIASALAEIRDLDCECRAKYADTFKRGFEFKMSSLQAANDKIVETIQKGYMGVVADLKRDVRIFSGSNVAIFVLLLVVSLLKPKAQLHLLVPAALLTVSTLICSYFYLFEQNWLLTIIHSDYVGFGYLAYLAIVVLILSDIVFNKGRVTSQVLNGFFNAIGSALSAPLC